ncbi:MAG: cob(I)yrinic acid a,c-diamide adenosyltransferase [Dehalococcoidia bacterium]
MKIYTKTGDQGETGLFAGGRVPKDDPRVDAYGCVDELNAVVGMARTQLADAEPSGALHRIESELFCLGADLATPLDAKADWIVRMDEGMVSRLEAEIDRFEEELEPLRQFILPGGSPAGATLHFARTVCRRAERRTVSLARAEQLNDAALRYLNRLSDWLFVAARLVNRRSGQVEEPWISPARNAGRGS